MIKVKVLEKADRMKMKRERERKFRHTCEKEIGVKWIQIGYMCIVITQISPRKIFTTVIFESEIGKMCRDKKRLNQMIVKI